MLPVALFGLLGAAVLLWLGAWQVQRLAWKNDIIARIETRLAADPVPLPAGPDAREDRFLRVRAEGEILPGEVHVYTSVPSHGVGYRIVAPMALSDGRRILIDRGFVPLADKDAPRPVGPATVVGSLDWPRGSDRFTGAPDFEKNVWIVRDVPLMAETLDTEPLLLVAETSGFAEGRAPVPVPVSPILPNSHLQYAITWFGLAAVWTGMTVYGLWRIKRDID